MLVVFLSCVIAEFFKTLQDFPGDSLLEFPAHEKGFVLRVGHESHFDQNAGNLGSLHGMKIEIDEEVPDIHQRVEFVLDGKKLKLNSNDRVRIGGFVVRVVEKKTKRSIDIGVEFYHLFRKQLSSSISLSSHLSLH